MKLTTENIIKAVNDWLNGTGITAELENEKAGEYSLLTLKLQGEALHELAQRFGSGTDIMLHWLLPDRTNGGCIVQDIFTGNKYSSGMIFRREEFNRTAGASSQENINPSEDDENIQEDVNPNEEDDDIQEVINLSEDDNNTRENINQSEDDEKAKNLTPQKKAPLHLCPNLDKGEVCPAWLHDVELKWKRFAMNIYTDNDGKMKCSVNNFIRLEAGLNAVFVSSSARNGARFDDEIIDEDANPLLNLEAKRQVLIDLRSRTLGRLRIPHATHEGRLCLFQTPESDLTGLKLNLAADAVFNDDGTIKRGEKLLSAAVGLIPYPYHTDGPRLMMGGKNMKQAEAGISGAEPPIVPGYYEGLNARTTKALIGAYDQQNLRFTPPLGVNALTVIMPYKGYTYEDGLVISKSLADKLCIEKSPYHYVKTFNAVIYQHDLDACGIDEDTLYKLNANISGIGERYVYGDALPVLNVPIFDEDDPGRELTLRENYNHHTPGILKSVDIKGIIKDTKGDKRKKTKYYILEITLCWNFEVKRQMGLGDKLTGRNGNKGVVTKVLPDKEMPQIHFKDEVRSAELIISPSSIMGRKNLGQIWEMTHSLLIQKGGESLRKILEENGSIDIQNMQLDDPEMEPILQELTELLMEIGADNRGTFNISGEGIPEGTRAFAGWQYFCRLHHHAWKKLQARGENAPYEETTGQPMRCGARTGQRMGEMENWALLSHGADKVLLEMREKQTGEFEKSREFFKKVLRSLGIIVFENNEGTLTFASRLPVQSDEYENALGKSDLYYLLQNFEDFDQPVRANIRGRDCKKEAEWIKKRLEASYKKSGETRLKKIINSLEEIINDEHFFNEDERENTKTGQIEKFYSLHVDPKLMRYKSLRKILKPFALPDSTPIQRAMSLIQYRDELINLLKGKNGIIRRFLLGRRYNHSGRAVIVPEPSLNLDTVFLPAAMLFELLKGYDDYRIDLSKKNLTILNDFHTRKDEAEEIASDMEKYLASSEGELWCFLIRQPSLHRHNVQAFRIRCWAEPVIGIPPLVTPGFNADFDGDTMAVFLPPYEFAKDLSAFSILNNPGLVGTGKPAFADGLDLALGWWASKNNTERTKFSVYLPQLLKNLDTDTRREELHKLQLEICEASTGSVTLTPLEFETLCDELEEIFDLHEQEGKKTELQEDAKSQLKKLLEKYNDYGLSVMLNSGAKGSIQDVMQMVWAIGSIQKMTDKDYTDEDYEGETETVFINGNFWQGLSDDELFDYSYPSRYSMAQKKLSVADAGYFTRQLAEGLYEFTVNKYDCGTDEGLEITYSAEHDRLLVDGFIFPTLGKIEDDLMRIAWGRVPVGKTECLNEKDIILKAEELRKGGKIIIRSPLHCKERENGHVCALCYGADIADKPYDSPVPVEEGFSAGITAAQAIGERGTQLAMKRFHDVSGESGNSDVLHEMRKLLIYGKKNIPHKYLKQNRPDKYSRSKKELLEMLFEDILRGNAYAQTANKELPQALIHYETALAQGWKNNHPGLRYIAQESSGCYLSAMTSEIIKKLLTRNFAGIGESDDQKSIKSRLIWEGGK